MSQHNQSEESSNDDKEEGRSSHSGRSKEEPRQLSDHSGSKQEAAPEKLSSDEVKPSELQKKESKSSPQKSKAKSVGRNSALKMAKTSNANQEIKDELKVEEFDENAQPSEQLIKTKDDK